MTSDARRWQSRLAPPAAKARRMNAALLRIVLDGEI